MDKKVFRSRISIILVVFIMATILPPLIRYGVNEGVYILAGTLLFCILVFTSIRYVIVDDKLYLKIWMITCSQVRIADIVLVKRSYNPLSSPAASLKRLCLYCKKYLGTVNQICFLISPVREQEFLDILKSINPDIDIQVTEKQGKWRFWDWDL